MIISSRRNATCSAESPTFERWSDMVSPFCKSSKKAPPAIPRLKRRDYRWWDADEARGVSTRCRVEDSNARKLRPRARFAGLVKFWPDVTMVTIAATSEICSG
jgi:hypothetical protein